MTKAQRDIRKVIGLKLRELSMRDHVFIQWI